MSEFHFIRQGPMSDPWWLVNSSGGSELGIIDWDTNYDAYVFRSRWGYAMTQHDCGVLREELQRFFAAYVPEEKVCDTPTDP